MYLTLLASPAPAQESTCQTYQGLVEYVQEMNSSSGENSIQYKIRADIKDDDFTKWINSLRKFGITEENLTGYDEVVLVADSQGIAQSFLLQPLLI